jgi:superfamily II DNA or RNA helicase
MPSEPVAGLVADLTRALPIYEIPDDDLVGEVLIPAMRTAAGVRIGAGFFTSQCLAQIAPGLADFLENSDQPLRLLMSPDISDDDRKAIERGLTTPERVIAETMEALFQKARLSESAVVHHALDCLAYLVAAKRLEARFVLMERGMYHKKIWLFSEGQNLCAVHGSGNATGRGLVVNGEQMTVDRPWMDGPSAVDRVDLLVRQWQRQWENKHKHSLTVTAPQILWLLDKPQSKRTIPTTHDFWEAWQRDYDAGIELALPPHHTATDVHHLLEIPSDIEWNTGRFGHQGRAVNEFLKAEGRGIFEIATGGGKTLTSLISATLLQDSNQGPTLLIILVPSTPLMLQWREDVRRFGVAAFLPSEYAPGVRRARIEELRAALAMGERRTEVIISTNKLFANDPSVRALVDSAPPAVLSMIIADEMHNLGVPSFLQDPPEKFAKRLGLSATPIRQYDPDGTDRLFNFFGPPVFEFDLGQAIGAGCLTPYEYYVHEVGLTHTEMDRYVALTEELRAAGFRVDDDGRTVIANPKVERLLRERRAVLEQAQGKLDVLRDLLVASGPNTVRRCLIYTSAKAVALGTARQIEQVNALLSELGIISHQFTSAETSRAAYRDLLKRFGEGDYQVLTAMKVLDEGIDIPQTDTAFLLASSTVRREWVQRRGRILRTAPEKKTATLHDFITVPPVLVTNEAKSIIRGELARIEEFASIARNEWANDGPRSVIAQYEETLWGGGST